MTPTRRPSANIGSGPGEVPGAWCCSPSGPGSAAGSSSRAGSSRVATAWAASAGTSRSRWTAAGFARAGGSDTWRRMPRPPRSSAGPSRPSTRNPTRCFERLEPTVPWMLGRSPDVRPKGDLLAVRLIRETARYLAVGAATVMHTIDPDLILFGGGMIAAGPASWRRSGPRSADHAFPAASGLDPGRFRRPSGGTPASSAPRAGRGGRSSKDHRGSRREPKVV